MILVDGQEASSVPADDRGLAYGDGCFETLQARHGRLPLLDYHLARLFDGLRALQFPDVVPQRLRRELESAARACGDGVVKLIVTRGSGGRGYRPTATEPRRIIFTGAMPAQYPAWREAGIRVRYCDTPLEGPGALAGMKHLNRLPQVLARAEWNDPDIHEGLMRDMAGRVICGTMSNLFVVRDDVLLTPPLTCGGSVRGVMRRLVLELAEQRGISWREQFLTDAEIAGADEILVTNGIIGVCPVRWIGENAFTIGTMTRLLQADVENELERRACSDD